MEDIYELPGLIQMYQATGRRNMGNVLLNRRTEPFCGRTEPFFPVRKQGPVCLH